MKHPAAVAVLAAAAMALTGCSSSIEDPSTGEDTRITERHVTTQDGREVTCLVYTAGYAGGLSCDWDGAAR